MQRYKNIPALRIGQLGSVVKRRVVICLAREHYAQSLSFQRNTHEPRKTEHNIAFRDTGRSARPGVRATMRWIKHHHGQSFLRRSGLLGGRLCRRWNLLLGSGRRSLRRELAGRRGRLCGLRPRRKCQGSRDRQRKK